jgi:polar amino acid transport system substrate-binding protein
MNPVKLLIAILAFSVFVSVVPAHALGVDDIVYLTEENLPANYTENGKLTGVSVELLKLIWAEMGYPEQKIQVIPWPRGYHKLQSEKGTCLFSTTWTKSRDEEEKFKWVGPIKPNNIALFARKDRNIRLKSIADAQKYKVGTVRDDVGEILLLEAGFDIKTLDRQTNVLTNIKMLDANRVDLLAKNTDSVFVEVKALGFNPEDFEVVWILSEKYHYYAFHKDTPQELIDRFQQALDKLDEKRQELLRKYGIGGK